MPLPMVHLSVAKQIADAGFPVKDLPQFYLGSISPDAIHMRQGMDFSEKMATHLIPAGKTKDSSWNDVDVNEYFKFMNDFFNANKCRANQGFLMGYAIHILTDMLWTKRVYQKFAADYKKSGAPVADQQKAYYRDTDIVDYILYNGSGWRRDVWQGLQDAEYSDFLDLLSAQEIELWNERARNFYNALENQYKFSGTPIYITKPDIENFISSCAEVILDNLKVAS